MSTTLIVVASATPATVVGALLMLGPALRIRRQAHIEIAAADAAVAKAEELYAENERTRNLPWHYAAIEAADPDVTGEVLAVAVHDPAVAAGLARLADEVGLAQALSEPCCTGHGDEPCAPDSGLVPPYCCGECPNRGAVLALSDEPEHDDEDAPADDTDRPGLWLVLLAIPVALWGRVVDWFCNEVLDRFKTDAARAREWEQVEGGPWSYEEDLLTQGVASPRHASDEQAEDTGYRGSRWAQDVQHTGQYPIVPAQRSGDADE